MLTFDCFQEDYRDGVKRVTINVRYVESVVEGQRKAAGYTNVAIITLASGERHTVLDGARNVAQRIKEQFALEYPA
ncbi:MAG: hypothetical protein IPM06_20785 [Rhizobiales bacterium]|nr:hypothetical protein [Hyphomicrobiales bacterium]